MFSVKKDMRKQYAEFCARGKPRDWNKRYRLGIEDYDKLCMVPGVRCIGITQDGHKLIVGTECIDVPDSHSRLREIGEFVITIRQMPPNFSVENATRTIDECHHPHVDPHGNMCISTGKTELQYAIVDGTFSFVVAAIIPALRMDCRHVTLRTQYQAAVLSKWPLKEVL